MAQFRNALGMILSCSFLIIVLALICMLGMGNVRGAETHKITTVERWEGATILSDSIEVTATGTLIVEDCLIVMNNSAPFPDIIVQGTLIMNRSSIIPLDSISENRYFFKVYGSCILIDNEFIRANSISLFSNDVYLSGNSIKETKADGIFIRGGEDITLTPRFHENIIFDSGLNGIRIMDAQADLMNNQVLGTSFDGIHVLNSHVTVTGFVFERIGRSCIFIGDNSTIDVFEEENLTAASISFQDKNSEVRVHSGNDVVVLKAETSEALEYLQLSILFGIIGLICMGGVHLFNDWNKDKTVPGGFAPQSQTIQEKVKLTLDLPEYKENTNVEAQVTFGDMAMSGGSFEAALNYYNDAIESTRSDDLLVRRGNALEKLGRYMEAFDNYESAYRINNDNKDAIEGMWWLKDAIKDKENIPEELEEKIFDFIRDPSRQRAIDEDEVDEFDIEELRPKALFKEETEGGRDDESDSTEKGEMKKPKPINIEEKDDQEGTGSQEYQPPAGVPEGPPMPGVPIPGGAAPGTGDVIRSPSVQPSMDDDPDSDMFSPPLFRTGPRHGMGGGAGSGVGITQIQPGSGPDTNLSRAASTPGLDYTNIDPDSLPTYREFYEGLKVPRLKVDINNIVQELNIDHLYFEGKELLLKQIATALASGKHIIFYGPPGTGKSAIATAICKTYQVDFSMVTGTSDWSTFDTIGGYMLEDGGALRFAPGLFLRSCQENGVPINKWLIIDEINRADIDKAFGPMFSALAGDNITLPHKIGGMQIEIEGKPKLDNPIFPYRFFLHPEWHILATMNTFDKTSLYEMSYAFMRRFSFISVQVPENIKSAVEGLVSVWGMEVDDEMKRITTTLWTIINEYRKIGPAILRDILLCLLTTKDYTSAINMYVLPQFEGLEERRLIRFKDDVLQQIGNHVDANQLHVAMEDFFNAKL